MCPRAQAHQPRSGSPAHRTVASGPQSAPPQAPRARGRVRIGRVFRVDAWDVELIVVRNAGYTGGERRSVSRDVERGLLVRVRQGVYVDRRWWDGLTGWEGARARHIVAIRALAEVAAEPPVFSHWSAAVLHGLPTVGDRLGRVHVTLPDVRRRGLNDVAGHVFPLSRPEVVSFRGVRTTSVARTVVDVAGASPIDGGLVIADAALFAGLPRALLEQAVDLVGPRRAAARIRDVVAMAHPGAESPNESETRWSMFRLGLAPQELQHEVWDGRGLAAVVDTYDEVAGAAGEADGVTKYLDPVLAPNGPGHVVLNEKKREDRVRAVVRAFGRWGYAEACNPPRLRPILARMGIRPPQHRPTIADYAAVARAALPRRRQNSR